MFNLRNKQCFTTVIVVVVAVIAFFYVVYPNINMGAGAEGFDAEVLTEPVKNVPYINPNTGTITAGPGLEISDVEGAGAGIQGVAEEYPNKIPSNYYFLDDGADGEMSLQHNLCSKSCCSEQWPTPFKQKHDPYVCGNKDQFVPSNMMCNNAFQDSGCLCLTKKQANFIYGRCGNDRNWN